MSRVEAVRGGAAAAVVRTVRCVLAALVAPSVVLALPTGGVSAETLAAQAADTLTLEDAIRAALSESPDVDAARATATAEGAARWADWGAFLPRASANARFGRSRFTTVTFQDPEGTARTLEVPLEDEIHSVSQGLTFQWDLLRGGRRIAELKAGGAAEAAAGLRLDAAERTAVAEVKAAYFEAVKRRRLADIAVEQLESRRRELERARERFRLAAVDRSDLLGAEGQVRAGELALLDAREAAREARRQLAVATCRADGLDATPRADTDREPTTGPPLAEPPPPPDPEGLDADRLVERALAGHPELAALEAEADAASARLWGERAGYLPDVSLSWSTSRSEQLGPDGSFFNFDPQNTARGLTLSASWELFGGFGRRERTARAGAELRRTRAQRAGRRLEVEKAVRDAVAEVRRRARRLELLRARRELARERLALTEEAFRTGSATFVELQSAVEEVTAAERGVVTERYDYLAAWARLERWAGDVR